MRAALAIAIVLVASCCRSAPKPTCPVVPAQPASAPVVPVVAKPLPCSVPAKPDRITMHATPNADGTTATAPVADFRALVNFLVAMQLRDDAMSACLEGR